MGVCSIKRLATACERFFVSLTQTESLWLRLLVRWSCLVNMSNMLDEKVTYFVYSLFNLPQLPDCLLKRKRRNRKIYIENGLAYKTPRYSTLS